MINFRKTIAVGLLATTLGMGVATTSTPAAAWGYHHGGWGWGIGGVAAGLALGAAPARLTTTAILDATSPASRSSTAMAILSAIAASAFATRS